MGLRWLFSPISEILAVPSLRQAACQVRLLLGLSFTRMWPSTASNCSGCAPSAGAAASNSLASAFSAALRVEEETPPTVVDPPEALSGGRSFDPIVSLIAPIGSPRVSAATWVMMVRVPVPRSCVPISTSTEPSGWMVVRHWLWCPPPPQALKPRPRPRFTGPEPPCPRGCHSFFQSAISAAFCNW